MSTIEASARSLRSQGIDRILLLGHSVGGQIGIAAAARWPNLFDGLVLVASGTPYWRAWPQAERSRIRAGVRFIDGVTRLLPWYPGKMLGFGGSQPRQVMRDWVGMALTGSYRHLPNGIDIEQAMNNLCLPTLAINIVGDSLAPSVATDYLLSKLPRVAAQRTTAGGTALNGMDPKKRHFAWVRQPLCITPGISRWLARAEYFKPPRSFPR